MSGSDLSPYLIAAAIMAALLVGHRLATGRWAVWRAVNGADDRPGTSKLQAFASCHEAYLTA